MNLTRGINLRKVAETMPGSSGAEVKGVCTEAGMYALRERRVHVTQEDFEMAVAKVGVTRSLIKYTATKPFKVPGAPKCRILRQLVMGGWARNAPPKPGLPPIRLHHL